MAAKWSKILLEYFPVCYSSSFSSQKLFLLLNVFLYHSSVIVLTCFPLCRSGAGNTVCRSLHHLLSLFLYLSQVCEAYFFCMKTIRLDNPCYFCIPETDRMCKSRDGKKGIFTSRRGCDATRQLNFNGSS